MTVHNKGMKSEFGTDLAGALKVLRAGGIILYPTDTVWGLGCDATNVKAVSRIYEIKQRAENKSLIILVNSVAMLERYVENPPEVAIEMAELSEKPLTVVYDRGRSLAEGVASSDGSVVCVYARNRSAMRSLMRSGSRWYQHRQT